MPTVSIICRPRLLVVHSVYRLYPGKLICAQCLQSMQSVCKLCTVSTCMHSVYRLYSGTHVCTQCLQIMQSVYKLCTVSTCIHSVYRLYVYARIRIHVHMYTCIRTNTYVSGFDTGMLRGLLWGFPFVGSAVKCNSKTRNPHDLCPAAESLCAMGHPLTQLLAT